MGKRERFFINIFRLTAISLFLLSCQPTDSPKQLTPAFYHWKSSYNPTASELELLQKMPVKKVYLHLFDVDWDPKTHQAIPKAVIRFQQKPEGNIVPVLFITNRTLLNLTSEGLSELATHISETVLRIGQQQDITFREVQFDCDWSTRTRDRYFRLLNLLSTQLRCPLSVTIRLHQIKYTDQTGIPPVSRGMLMLYNVADWKRADTRNSIYDADVANQYLSFVKTYPLPLDLVLPLFRWTVVYRNGRFLTFLTNLDREKLANSPFLTAQPDSVRFVANRDTSAFGFSIRRGDLFRTEAVSSEVLLTEKERVLRQIKNPTLTFALYHLDSTVLAAYSRETIQTLLRPIP
ncbi:MULTISPECIES: hypothetical protein [unclassified Spirosoma]|uniref:hypothetical protein n=1 Tax=unclassified Spirosoma TaxID=2621999 RepID=UPI0009630449|nr:MULTISPECIES: hypothetical protein [unclassified Spirosoma]MBN8821550.1 hypothetical protein [Spirosoma sp.]OJW78327.1 MAG: hypothetical protein BGO59_30420 [Spirosoma sp. 48-14]